MYEFQSQQENGPAQEPSEDEEPMFCPFLKAECNQNCALIREEEDGTLSCSINDIADALDVLANGKKSL